MICGETQYAGEENVVCDVIVMAGGAADCRFAKYRSVGEGLDPPSILQLLHVML